MRTVQQRRTLKWLGTMTCLLLAFGWLGTFAAQAYLRLGYFNLSLDHGAVCVWISDHFAPAKVRLTRERCQMHKWWPRFSLFKGSVGVDVPFWIVLAPFFVLTLRLWNLRGIPPDQCAKCRVRLESPSYHLCGQCRWSVTDKRFRRRTVLSWIALSMSALLIVAWGASVGKRFTYCSRQWAWELESGRIKVTVDAYRSGDCGRSFFPAPTQWLWWPDASLGYIVSYVYIPVWLLLLVCMGVAYWLWRSDRRGSGMCMSCGYDLTGNESGACPECGTGVDERVQDP